MIRKAIRALATLILVCGAVFAYGWWRTRPVVPDLVANVNERAMGDLRVERTTLRTSFEDETAMDEGWIVVPEDRSDPNTNRIELYFRLLRTEAVEPSPPVFFFAGGPGSSSTRIAETQFYYLFRDIQRVSDVVLLDQRGTGQSNPSLACHNSLKLPTEIRENAAQQLTSAVATAVGKCADRLSSAGVVLAAYNSIESADDIDAVREQLGYEAISLFGYSYGTKLAQHYIARHGERVDRAVFAAPLAPDEALKLPSRVNAKFHAIDSLLARDPAAERYVPRFADMMRSVHDDLRREPEFIRIPLMDAVGEGDGALGTAIFKAVSVVKPYWELTLTDQHLQMMMATRGGDPSWTRRLPAFYNRMANGDFREAGNFLRNFRRETVPNLLFFTETCATGFPDGRWERAVADSSHALRHDGISFGRHPDVCTRLGIDEQEGAAEPVFGDHEVLLLAGTLDSQTPVPNMRTVAARFPKSVSVVVENATHTDLLFDATGRMIVEFLRGELTADGREVTVTRAITFDPVAPFGRSLSDTLYAEILRGGPESAVSLYRDIRDEHSEQTDYVWDLRENSLNALGYRLLGEGLTAEAIAIFELNVEAFPEAYNPYNSLGEAYLAAGRRDDARAVLVKAIELNPYDGNSYLLLNRLDRGEM